MGWGNKNNNDSSRQRRPKGKTRSKPNKLPKRRRRCSEGFFESRTRRQSKRPTPGTKNSEQLLSNLHWENSMLSYWPRTIWYNNQYTFLIIICDFLPFILVQSNIIKNTLRNIIELDLYLEASDHYTIIFLHSVVAKYIFNTNVILNFLSAQGLHLRNAQIEMAANEDFTDFCTRFVSPTFPATSPWSGIGFEVFFILASYCFIFRMPQSKLI